MRQRIRLQRATIARDETGAEVKTWSTYDEVWAEFLSSTAKELYRAKQANAEVTHGIRIRYRPRVEFTDRVLYGTRVLDITDVQDPQERHVEILLICKEIR